MTFYLAQLVYITLIMRSYCDKKIRHRPVHLFFKKPFEFFLADQAVEFL